MILLVCTFFDFFWPLMQTLFVEGLAGGMRRDADGADCEMG